MQDVLIVSNNPCRKIGGRRDVAFADGICVVATHFTTYMADKLN